MAVVRPTSSTVDVTDRVGRTLGDVGVTGNVATLIDAIRTEQAANGWKAALTAPGGGLASQATLASIATLLAHQGVAGGVPATLIRSTDGGELSLSSMSDAAAGSNIALAARAFGYLFNGSTWDRQRDANAANGSIGTGVPGAGSMGWDSANSVWRRLLVDTSGFLRVSSAATPGDSVSGGMWSNIGLYDGTAYNRLRSASAYTDGVGLGGGLPVGSFVYNRTTSLWERFTQDGATGRAAVTQRVSQLADTANPVTLNALSSGATSTTAGTVHRAAVPAGMTNVSWSYQGTGWTGTINYEYSLDGGTNWVTFPLFRRSTVGVGAATSPAATGQDTWENTLPTNATHVQFRVTAYTAGTLTSRVAFDASGSAASVTSVISPSSAQSAQIDGSTGSTYFPVGLNLFDGISSYNRWRGSGGIGDGSSALSAAAATVAHLVNASSQLERPRAEGTVGRQAVSSRPAPAVAGASNPQSLASVAAGTAEAVPAGATLAEFQFNTAALVGTAIFEYLPSDASTWTPGPTYRRNSSGGLIAQTGFSMSGAVGETILMPLPPGATQVRVRLSAYTSGTLTYRTTFGFAPTIVDTITTVSNSVALNSTNQVIGAVTNVAQGVDDSANFPATLAANTNAAGNTYDFWGVAIGTVSAGSGRAMRGRLRVEADQPFTAWLEFGEQTPITTPRRMPGVAAVASPDGSGRWIATTDAEAVGRYGRIGIRSGATAFAARPDVVLVRLGQ